MSKLSDLLKQASQAYVRPMGFAPVQSRQQALPMVLIAQIDSLDAAAVDAAVSAGAEAVLAPMGVASDAVAVKSAKNAAGRALLGGVLDAGGKDDVARLERDGCDFLLIRNTNVAAEVLSSDDENGKLLELDPNWPDTMLRGVDGLQVEGVVYRIAGSETLTINHLLQLRRAAGLAGKPLFIAAPAGLPATTASVLRDAGAVGLIVPSGAVAEYKETVRNLPPPKRQKERMDAMLPAGFAVGGKEPEHDDDDGDDDD